MSCHFLCCCCCCCAFPSACALPAFASCAVILSFFSQTAQRPKKYAMKVGSSHAAHHLEGLKFDQSSKAKAKKTRWRGGKKEKERKKNMNERTYMQIGSRKLRHMRKDPRGVGGGRTECRIRWALAMFANLDTLWQIWLKSLSQLSNRKKV